MFFLLFTVTHFYIFILIILFLLQIFYFIFYFNTLFFCYFILNKITKMEQNKK